MYTSEANRQYLGADRNSASDTKDECEVVCDQDSDCVGFAFYTQPNPGKPHDYEFLKCSICYGNCSNHK